MKIIRMLSNLIEEEQEDACKYAKLALQYKEERPTLADTFYKLSTEEVAHANALHERVVEIIIEYRKTHGEPPENMKAVYDYLHEKHIDKAAEIKTKQAMYKG